MMAVPCRSHTTFSFLAYGRRAVVPGATTPVTGATADHDSFWSTGLDGYR